VSGLGIIFFFGGEERDVKVSFARVKMTSEAPTIRGRFRGGEVIM